MVTSEAFTRSGKNHWALASWGLPEYRPIQEAISEMVDTEGSVPLDLVIARLLPTGVQESSIRTYATSPPFIVTDGMVRRSARLKVVRKTIEQTRNLYHLQNGVAHRVKLNSEHFRGSGFACPAALASYLGVTSAAVVTLKSEYGDFKVSSRGAMFHLPSIRRAAQALNLQPGEDILIQLTKSDVVFRKVHATGELTNQILSMVGIEHSVEDLSEILSIAISGRKGLPVSRTLDLLIARKELDLADKVQKYIESPTQLAKP